MPPATSDREHEVAVVATVADAQNERVRPLLNRLEVAGRANADLFDLEPSYTQTNGKEAPIWSSRVLIAAKGVADHIVPWSHTGRTHPANLANVCAGCNYSRSDTSLDTVRVAAYDPPASPAD